MDALNGFVVWFVLTLAAFFAGVVTHWWATRKKRRMLRRYQEREQLQRWLDRPVE